jgi:hypothetical protein
LALIAFFLPVVLLAFPLAFPLAVPLGFRLGSPLAFLLVFRSLLAFFCAMWGL